MLEKEKNKILALPGIEPGLTRPQRGVLPLDHSTFDIGFVPKVIYNSLDTEYEHTG